MTDQVILTMTKKAFPVVEVFGPTIQGEGALAGTVSHFIRFGGCDFACAWCDSAHAVLPEYVRQANKLTVSDIGRAILELPHAEWVTLSGGNPALHDLGKLVELLHANDFFVAVETQGSMWKPWLLQIDRLTISPKPPSSGMVNPFLPKFLDYAVNGAPACIKIPIYDLADLDWAEQIHLENPEFDFYLSIVTEMGGLDGSFAAGRIDTAEDLLGRYRGIAESVLQRPSLSDARIIPQLHFLIWGNITGV